MSKSTLIKICILMFIITVIGLLTYLVFGISGHDLSGYYHCNKICNESYMLKADFAFSLSWEEIHLYKCQEHNAVRYFNVECKDEDGWNEECNEVRCEDRNEQ